MFDSLHGLQIQNLKVCFFLQDFKVFAHNYFKLLLDFLFCKGFVLKREFGRNKPLDLERFIVKLNNKLVELCLFWQLPKHKYKRYELLTTLKRKITHPYQCTNISFLRVSSIDHVTAHISIKVDVETWLDSQTSGI